MRDFVGFETMAKKLEDDLKHDLDRCGIMYRLFHRVKSMESIENKVKKKGYNESGDKLTDLIGLRITLYFKDDVEIVRSLLKDKVNFDHESTDDYKVDEFKPVRCNLTFNLPEPLQKEAELIIAEQSKFIDTKYEIQIRTVLSEGWHEVEHDLRYKCASDWESHDDLSRIFNGIFASLETSEFSMLQLFDNLAYRHYKQENIEALLKTKFRLRIRKSSLSDSLKSLLIDSPDILKKIQRINRNKFLLSLLHSGLSIPLTIDNLIFLLNYFEVQEESIRDLENSFVKSELDILST